MKLSDMTWPEIRNFTQRPDAVAVLPLGSTEQHGPHLALSVDSTLVTAIAEGAEEAAGANFVLCPTLEFGSSHHHFGFAGTMSLSSETYVLVLLDLVESLLHSGFRRILLLNGHGGNMAPARHALEILSRRHDDTLRPNIAFACYWDLAEAAFHGAAPMETPALTHADEYETSLMLHLCPARVHMDRVGQGVLAPPNEYVRWQRDRAARGVTVSKAFHFLFENGANGRPDLANASKGEHLFVAAVEAVTEFLEDFRTWPFLQDLRVNENQGGGTS